MSTVLLQQIQAAMRQRTKENRWTGIVGLGALFLLGIFLVFVDAPPAALGADVSPMQFSAERALKHVEAIGRAPHPVGSAGHREVENYIINTLQHMGLTPQLQKATAHDRWMDVPIPLENIVASVKGTTSDKSVLLVAHYDSVPAGPGASDDGAAVAALLETANIFKSGAPFKRDILFLFTDGEELGLLGAHAFVAENSLAKNVGVVVNFDARGTTGPVILFETSDKNAWLIDSVSKAASHPVANSLSYEIYKRLPNDTDFTVFKRAGYPGLNFAFIDGVVHYHTASDDLRNLDRGSLQHEGDYAVELGRWFGNADEIKTGQGNAIYFDILGRVLVHYSPRTETLLLIAAAMLMAWMFFRGFRQGNLGAASLALSMVVLLVGIIAVPAVSFVVQRIAGLLAARFQHVRASTLNYGGYHVAAATAFGMAVASVLYIWAIKRFGPVNVAAATLLVWFSLALSSHIWVPGMSYLWTCPLLFVAVGWVLAIHTDRQERSKLLLGAVIPAILIVIPLAHKVFTAFALGSGVIVSTLLALLLPLCVVQTGPDVMPRPSVLPITLCIGGALSLAIALIL